MPPPAVHGYGEEPDGVPQTEPEPPHQDPDQPAEDDEVLLRSALSDVVASDDAADGPAVARRRGLGARVQEAKEAGE